MGNKKKLMKTFYFIILILCFSSSLYSQDNSKKADVLLFEKAIYLQDKLQEELQLKRILFSADTASERYKIGLEVNESILEKSWELYQEIIDDYPNSDLFYNALYNQALLDIELGDTDDAELSFKKILKELKNDKNDKYSYLKASTNRSLANISINNGKHNEALNYLDNYKKYPFKHFCGNAHASYNTDLNTMYAKCYLGLNEIDKAYDILLPNLLEDGMSDNSEIVQLTYETLLKKYEKEELKRMYNKAFDELIVENNKDYREYFIVFLNTKLKLNFFGIDFLKDDKNKEALNAMRKNSKFYKLLND